MKDLFIEPAFPTVEQDSIGGMLVWNTTAGMTKRFYAACAAMQGLCAVNDKGTFGSMEEVYEKLITHSYKLADELLKQEQNETNN